MTARIYTGAEAEALLSALHPSAREELAREEPDWNDLCSYLGCAEMFAAAPDLAASVAHHEARAERAEAERDRWRDALRDAAGNTHVATAASDDDPEGLALNIVDVLTTLQEPSEERDDAVARAEAAERKLDTLRAAAGEWAAACAAWDAYPDGSATASAVHHRRTRAEDALRALVGVPR